MIPSSTLMGFSAKAPPAACRFGDRAPTQNSGAFSWAHSTLAASQSTPTQGGRARISATTERSTWQPALRIPFAACTQSLHHRPSSATQ